MTAETTEVQMISPSNVRRLYDRLEGHRESLTHSHNEKEQERKQRLEYLAVAGAVTQKLDEFNTRLFNELVRELEVSLTRAMAEVLQQPIEVKVELGQRSGLRTFAFYVERAGKREDIMKGQGGSVVNVLSVGLRIQALQQVDEKLHRRFLVLDEQDCWLHPDLVPRLVNLVHDAGKQMGYQVLMVSHHDPMMFQKYADRVYRCRPSSDANGNCVIVEKVPSGRDIEDSR